MLAPSLHVELPYGGNGVVVGACNRLDGAHELGRGAQGVAPQSHRHRARVSRFAGENDPRPGLPGDRADDPQRDAGRFERRTLLDVDLVVADQVGRVAPGAGQAIRVAAERAHCVGQRDAGRVASRQVCAVETAGDHAAAEVTGAEADALLIGEREHLDRVWQRPSPIAQSLDTGDCDEHPEHAVVASRVAHRVEVRAE